MAGISVAFLLISAAIGYKTLLRTEELKKDAALLKICGRVLGVTIIAVSLISVGCITFKVHCLKSYKKCSQMRTTCPYKGKGSTVHKGSK